MEFWKIAKKKRTLTSFNKSFRKYTRRNTRKNRRHNITVNKYSNRYSNKKRGGSKSPSYIIKIFASWCGACKGFKPMWDELKKTNHNKNIIFNEIEETQFNDKSHELFKNHTIGEILKSVDVPHYPTIIKIINGKVKHFNGTRTLDELKKWIGGA